MTLYIIYLVKPVKDGNDAIYVRFGSEALDDLRGRIERLGEYVVFFHSLVALDKGVSCYRMQQLVLASLPHRRRGRPLSMRKAEQMLLQVPKTLWQTWCLYPEMRVKLEQLLSELMHQLKLAHQTK